jgi:1,2-diacylglycerol 3-alpha-glucosyltransferase
MRVAVIFDNFGPYHLARLQAAAGVSELLAIQMNARSKDYAWASSQRHPFESITLHKIARDPSRGGLTAVLSGFMPQCVFIPGWARGYSLAALGWCRANRVPAVLMSESAEHDKRRRDCQEWLKRKLVSLFSAALVGGSAHAAYLAKLGMNPQCIHEGYDVVDNEYFTQGTARVRAAAEQTRQKHGLPDRYFLASARLIERKNLMGLMQAYARYRDKFTVTVAGGGCPTEAPRPWNLVMLGDGPQRDCLCQLVVELRLEKFIRFAGFLQYPELPIYYGLAGAFVHASLSEPWGLVVNEAMASALPVIVSNRCGCASDLVHKSNGFTFDPANVEELSTCLLKMSTDRSQLEAMGKASLELVSSWGPQRFACGFLAAAQHATQYNSQRAASIPDVLLQLVFGS